MEQIPAVELRSVCKSFGATRAVDDVTVRFDRHQVHCLLGENGAGKSTVGRICAGLMTPDSGQTLVDGELVRFRNVAEAERRGVVMVHQELSLAPDLTVRENICLSSRPRHAPLGIISHRAEAQSCRLMLEEVGIDLPLERRVGTLQAAAQQLVEIVKAFRKRPRVLVLDEPTAMLGIDEARRLVALIRRIRDRGVAIVLITHHVEEVVALADHISLMRDGRLVETVAAQGAGQIASLVGRLSGGKRPKPPGDIHTDRPGSSASTLLLVDGVPGGTIVIRPGEVVSLYGVVGCGRERIAAAVAGFSALSGLVMKFGGMPYAPRRPAGARRRGVGWLPSGRAANGIFPQLSIAENLLINESTSRAALAVRSPGRDRSRATLLLESLFVRYRDATHLITTLSGGNQQKVLLGRCLNARHRLLVLEEPTAGVDLGAKNEIHALIRLHVAEGLSVMLVSSDLLETMAISDAIYTMSAGRIVRRFDTPAAQDEHSILADVIGVAAGQEIASHGAR